MEIYYLMRVKPLKLFSLFWLVRKKNFSKKKCRKSPILMIISFFCFNDNKQTNKQNIQHLLYKLLEIYYLRRVKALKLFSLFWLVRKKIFSKKKCRKLPILMIISFFFVSTITNKQTMNFKNSSLTYTPFLFAISNLVSSTHFRITHFCSPSPDLSRFLKPFSELPCTLFPTTPVLETTTEQIVTKF